MTQLIILFKWWVSWKLEWTNDTHNIRLKDKTMTKVATSLEADHLVVIEHCIETEVELGMRKITDRIIEIDHKTTTEMTMGEKIIGRFKISSRNIEVDIEIITETYKKIGIGTIKRQLQRQTQRQVLRWLYRWLQRHNTDTSPETHIEIAIEMTALIKVQDINLEKDIDLEKMFLRAP